MDDYKRGLELQLTMRARVIETANDRALTLKFYLGPFAFFLIANLPTRKNQEPLAYLKVRLIPNEEWSLFQDLDKDQNG